MASLRPDQLLPLLREMRGIDRRRTSEGITPLEYLRFLDLRRRLERHMGPAAAGEGSEKSRTSRILIEFRSPASLARARIRNVNRGGLFLSTPFAPDLGTQFELRVRVKSTGDELLLPCEVVSNHVGDDFSTQDLGMGVQFGVLDPKVKGRLEKLFVDGERIVASEDQANADGDGAASS
ncbi:MAG: PilZ domain-containing protein [Myxococcota bacterium]